MADSPAVDDDDGDEGEGDGDDDDEGDGNESATPAETEDQDMKDAPSLPIPGASTDPAPTSTVATLDAPESNTALAPPSLDVDASRVEGSPLKNVLVQSPKEPSPRISPKELAAAESEQSLSQVPWVPTLGLQPSPVEAQESVQPTTLPEPMVEVADDIKPEAPKDEELKDETSAIPSPEDTTGVVAITSTQEPATLTAPLIEEPTVPPVAVEQPPAVEELSQVPTSIADIPLPTSEEPMPGQVPKTETELEPEPSTEQAQEQVQAGQAVDAGEAPQVEVEVPAKQEQPVEEAIKTEEEDIKAPEEAPKSTEEVIQPEDAPEDAPTDVSAPAAADVVMEDSDAVAAPAVPEVVEAPPAEQTEREASAPSPSAVPAGAPPEQAPPEEGTDDGFNILGSLSDSLNRQAQEDVPAATAAAPPSEEVVAPTEIKPATEEEKPATEDTAEAGQ